jgi:mannose-6-phosphate isomerase-like protein (cupin superfamily)
VKPHLRHLGGFRWDGVPLLSYKEEGSHFRDVSRQVLFGAEAGGASELRYFEVLPGGHTTLERHEHVHQVMILRGEGRCLVDREVLGVRRFDLVRVPPGCWHQFRAGPDQPLGFLCLVDRERDRPRRPSLQELEDLRADPVLAEFLRS